MVHVAGDEGWVAWTNGVDASVAGKLDSTTAGSTYAPVAEPVALTKVAKGELVINVKDYGAVGNSTTDDTAAIQAAINAADAAHGGTVYLPVGKYKITALSLAMGVRLTGETFKSVNVYETGVNPRGSWLYCISTTSPAVLMSSETVVQNLGFFYPNQVTNATPTVYPPSIKTQTSHVQFLIRDVMLQNSYIGIECNTSHENLTIQNVQGLPLYQGIVLDQGSDLDRIENVNFSWNCWYEAGTTLKTWISANATAFTIRKTDWGFLTGSNAFGYHVGLLVETSPISGVPGGFNFSRLGFDACVQPVVVTAGVCLKFSQIIVVQYNYFDLTQAFPAFALTAMTTSTFSQIVISSTYGNGINLTTCSDVKIGDVVMGNIGQATPTTPAKMGVLFTGGNNRISIRDCFINCGNNANTYGVFLTGTNAQINISDNHIFNAVVSSIFLDTGSTFVICKNNIAQNSGALSDGLGAVTKDISSNMPSVAWTAYTPALTAATTNPNIGTTGTITGAYSKTGRDVKWRTYAVTGGTGIAAGSGQYGLSLPVVAVVNQAVGSGLGYLNSAFKPVVLDSNGGVIARLLLTTTGASMDHTNGIAAGVAGQVIEVSGTFESAT